VGTIVDGMATPDFILELRSMIGHHPLWLPGVTALVTDEEGRILLGQRADNGLWALPSGIPEPQEEMAAAAAREVLEETGVHIVVEQLVSIRSQGPVTYPNGDVTAYVDHFFRCRPVSGTAHVADDESLDVGWFRPDRLPEPVSGRTHELLKEAEDQALDGLTRFIG
jgi:8-oxo-dGTP pyrophosphatase MutT (NUDIX family)